MLIPIALVIAVAVFRALKANLGLHEFLPNFCPVAAIALCGTSYMSTKKAFWIPVASMFLADLAISYNYDLSMWSQVPTYIFFGLLAVWGLKISERKSVVGLIGRVSVGSFGFYLLSNTMAWFMSSYYQKTLMGWVVSQTTGTPGFPPPIYFLGYTWASDLIFTASIIFLMDRVLKSQGKESIPMLSPATA